MKRKFVGGSRYPSKRIRSNPGYGSSITGAALLAARGAYNMYQRYRGSGTTRRTGGGVTQQHDTRTQYTKRSQPKYKKRKWVKFIKKVKAVTEKGVGTQNFLFNDTHNAVAGVGSQAVTSVMIYGGSLATEIVNTRGYSDINKIMNIVSPTSGLPTSVSDLARTGNLQFTSAVLDLTIKNLGTDILELDMYEIYFKGNKDLGQSLGRSIEDCY